MKPVYAFLLLLFCLGAARIARAQTHTPRYISMMSKTKAYYEYLPAGYDPNGTATYPLILFMTGIGEFGNGSPAQLPDVLKHGIPKLINAGTFPTSFTVNGETHRFIVITPQFIKYPRPTAEDMDSVLDYIVANYKVNSNRIYITGLSYGGGLCWAYAGESATYAKRIAAIVPIASPVPDGGDATIYTRSRVIAANNVAVWATHNLRDQDDTVATTITYINDINQPPAPTPPAKMSLFNAGGHDAWTRTYNPDFKENGLNVYEWMLQYQRNKVVNQPPQANAGADQTITLPTSQVTLNGSGTDADGSIASYSWTKESGPAAGAITSPSANTTSVTGLTEGSYVFRLTVTDNSGATATDAVTIIVNAAPNTAPKANAGADQTITLPVNSVDLKGSGTDSDGSIATYNWTKVSGPAGETIATPQAAATSVTGLVQGSYVFRLTVTDNDGARASDDLSITVNEAPNQAPVANAGADITITLPENTATLSGTGTDADGSIVSYLWKKISGPAAGSIASQDAASTAVNNLTAGSYVFRLTVTDNKGATASDDVSVVVNAAPNKAPVADAGSNMVITLPVTNADLKGSGTDEDGTVTSYVWTKVSGPAGETITAPNVAVTSVTGLVQGLYVFRLTVTDNDGATASDEVSITVNTASNKTPVSNAGNDVSLTLPVNTTTLSGSGTDEDGTIVSYLWSKVSGPVQGDIASNDAATTKLNNLVQGTYVFRLTVTDNDGAAASDDVSVAVNAAANQAPVADAGADVVTTLPQDSVTLFGSGSDADGTIAAYAWTKVSGPAQGTITSSTAAVTKLHNLVQGTYVFRLTVTDNDGATELDDVTVTVLAAPVVNQPPQTDAGPDQGITLPVDSVVLNGTAVDADGTIATYSWTQVSGPSDATMTTSDSATTIVTALKQGSYVFRLTVTDNAGASDSDDVKVDVSVVTAIDDSPAAAGYRVIVAPNPSSSYFSMKVVSPGNKPVYLRVTDALGRVVEERKNLQQNRVFTIGHSYMPGVYYAVIVQGGKPIVVRLLKTE